jgi:hypothetical protein
MWLFFRKNHFSSKRHLMHTFQGTLHPSRWGEANLRMSGCCDAEIAPGVESIAGNSRQEKKMGAGDCIVRHQKPRPQICVVSKVTVFQER